MKVGAFLQFDNREPRAWLPMPRAWWRLQEGFPQRSVRRRDSIDTRENQTVRLKLGKVDVTAERSNLISAPRLDVACSYSSRRI